VSEFQPLAAVARLVGGDEGAPADGAWAVPSFLAGDFDDDDDGAAAAALAALLRRVGDAGDDARAHRDASDGVVAGVEARLRGGGLAAARGAGGRRPCRLRLKRRRGDGAACLVLVAPGAGGWARVPLHRVVGVRAADGDGAGHALALFDDKGDRREAHELAVGAAATRDALVLALEALAARERARHGVHRRRFRADRAFAETVAAAREAAAAPADEPLARPPLSPSPSILDDAASSSDDDDDDARALDVARVDGAAAAWAVDAAGASFRVTLRGGDALDVDVAAARRGAVVASRGSADLVVAPRPPAPAPAAAAGVALVAALATGARPDAAAAAAAAAAGLAWAAAALAGGPARLSLAVLRRQKRAAPRAALESPRRRASSRPAARDDPGGFSGRWVNDRQRSDHMGDQLLGIGIPWVIRETLLRSSNVKLISRDGLDWTEESVTTLVSKVQRLRLDGVRQEDAHPIDGSKVRIWSAVGARPPLAPAPDAAADPPPPGAIVTVMEYVGYDAVSTITRTVRGGAYVVRNDLLKRKTREAVSTTSVFVRDDACC